jgi:protein phosphatase
MSGKNNEDNYAVTAHQLNQEDPTPSLLAVLADGVGGHLAGEVAAEIATETISEVVLESDAADPPDILKQAIIQANQKVANQSTSQDDRLGMGSTCACVWVIDNRIYTASVGDSRIYFIRDGQIQQITTDHTWVQEAIDHGIIKPEQARNHPRAHVIRRYLGTKKTIEPDFRLRLNSEETDEEALAHQGMTLLPGDQLLLCSDGLTDLVEDHEILDALQNRKREAAVQFLVDLANERGGHDNITIITLQMPHNKVAEKIKGLPPSKPKFRLSWQVYLAIGIFIIVSAALAVVLYFYVSRMPPKSPPTPTTTLTVIVEAPPTQDIVATTQMPSATDTALPQPTQTSILETYTPWPTNTLTPEP